MEKPIVTRMMLSEIQNLLEFEWATRSYCRHTHRETRAWLRAHVPADQVEPAIDYLRALGGTCDCKVYTEIHADDLPDEPA